MNRRTFTLWEIMNHYCALQMTGLLETIAINMQALEGLKKRKGGGSIVEPSDSEVFTQLTRQSSKFCMAVGFTDALLNVSLTLAPFQKGRPAQDVSTHLAALRAIQLSIRDELSKRHFLVVAPDRTAYLEAPPEIEPFTITYQGYCFWGNDKGYFIKAASNDIRDAGNCLAAECHTASVFHAMRVAEHGLRYLAGRMKVTLTHKGKRQPIEQATWEKIIATIKSKLEAAHKLHHSPRRQKQLSYYSDLADRCLYMKDLWRNEVMHSKRSFNRLEAAGILQRVREFMQLLEPKSRDGK